MSEEKKEEGKLSDEQIENWRKVLVSVLGPYALIARRNKFRIGETGCKSKLIKLLMSVRPAEYYEKSKINLYLWS